MGISSKHFDTLREYVEKVCGINLRDNQAYLLESRLAQVLVRQGCKDFGEFCSQLSRNPNGEIRKAVIDAITTNETSFFRDQKPFDLLREEIWPILMRDLSQGKRQKVRIWSAACSTGQEPYSIAISLLEFLDRDCPPGVDLSKIEILATDISPAALFMATSGRYSPQAIRRGLSPDRIRRFFHQEGQIYIIGERIHRMVQFRQFNLQDSASALGRFDLIFCRNVVIYFSKELKQKVFSELARVTTPGGFLILGGVESLIGFETPYRTIQTASGVYHRLPDRPE